MTHFVADLDHLLSTIADLGAFEERLSTLLSELDEVVDELHGTWSGVAATGHRDAHARWRAGADEMHRAGVLMRKAAQRAHDNYAAAADANEQMWQQAR